MALRHHHQPGDVSQLFRYRSAGFRIGFGRACACSAECVEEGVVTAHHLSARTGTRTICAARALGYFPGRISDGALSLHTASDARWCDDMALLRAWCS